MCVWGCLDERIKLTREIFRFRCLLLVYQSVCNQTASSRKWSRHRLGLLINLTSLSLWPIWLLKGLRILRIVVLQISCDRYDTPLKDSLRPAVTEATVNVSTAVKGQRSQWETHDIRLFYSPSSLFFLASILRCLPLERASSVLLAFTALIWHFSWVSCERRPVCLAFRDRPVNS